MYGWSARDRARVRTALGGCEDARAVRRMMAVLLVMQGHSQAQAAAMLGVAELSVWRWLERYRQSRDPLVLHDAHRSGRPRVLETPDLEQLRVLLQSSPQGRGLAAVNWSVPLLQQELRREGGPDCSRATLRRALHELDLVWKRPRYVLERDPDAEGKRGVFSAG